MHTDELHAHFGERYKWRVMLTVMIGTMTMVLSATIVNVALPTIMETYAVSHTGGQWLVTGFLASMAVGMLMNAWLVERYGARRTYLAALSLFAGVSLAGGLAVSFEMLVLVRVAQGLIAGVVQPLALLLIYSVFPVNQRGQAMGLYGMGVILGPTFGPAMGGVLVDLISWRAVFFVVLPTCAYAFWLACRYLGQEQPEQRPQPMDLPGALLLGGWLVALLWALANGSHLGWHSGVIIAAFTSFAVLFTAFALRQLRSSAPLLALEVFRHPGFPAACLVAMLTGAGLFGSVYLLPLLVQIVLERSASTAGMVLIPAGLAMAVTFAIAGRLTDRVSPGAIAGTGMVLYAVSCLVLGFAGAGLSLLLITIMAAIGRMGLSLSMPPIMLQAIGSLPAGLVNQGTGVISFARQLGASLGVTGTAILLQERSGIMAGLGLPGASPGFQDAFLLFAVLFLIGLLPLSRLARASRR